VYVCVCACGNIQRVVYTDLHVWEQNSLQMSEAGPCLENATYLGAGSVDGRRGAAILLVRERERRDPPGKPWAPGLDSTETLRRGATLSAIGAEALELAPGCSAGVSARTSSTRTSNSSCSVPKTWISFPPCSLFKSHECKGDNLQLCQEQAPSSQQEHLDLRYSRPFTTNLLFLSSSLPLKKI